MSNSVGLIKMTYLHFPYSQTEMKSIVQHYRKVKLFLKHHTAMLSLDETWINFDRDYIFRLILI